MGKNFKDSLNLPRTKFPMRANLSDREPGRIEWWNSEKIYGRILERRRNEGAERFILHDGPPYANGNIHHGHILNKTLKDFVVKYRNMAGELCEFVPGWDCHGLPIEHKVDEQLGEAKLEMSKVEVRKACREYAAKFVDIQREEFKRVMVFGEWDDPYVTMSYDYEAATVRELGAFFDRGIVYRGFKPVHWDWDANTALAEAEVEYDTFRTEQVYVKFPFAQLPEELAEKAGDRQAFVVIWTTTPWTLPANLAVALNPELEYELVAVGDEAYVLAKGLRDQVIEACEIEEFEVLATFEGRALVGELGVGQGLKARHPWLDRDSVLLPADYVTLDQGTGCVHTAPGHGQEDFELGQHFGLGVICPVDENGKYRSGQVEEFGGMHVFRANKKIAEKLDEMGLLLNEPGDRITIDRYPFGWRSKKPVIFRATEQWFVAMEPETVDKPDGFRLREAALEEIKKVRWVPEWGQDRIEGMVEGRPDWCISRQRVWGVPITVMYCKSCDEALAQKEIADHVADLVEDHGADVWFERDASELVPEGTTCPSCGADEFRKEEDILDVWFDSGTSWAAVLESKLGIGDRADLYLEGSDQHRGWFQSSLMCGVVSRGHSPYDTCLTHGFVTDEKGHKYSKSSKNFEPPEKMLAEYGAEILRLWVAAVDYRGDIALSGQILDRISDAYRKIRNTFRFLLGNLDGFDPNEAMAVEELEEIDRWILHRAAQLVERCEEAYKNYEFHTIYHGLVQFCTVDLSNLYMDVTKDRMYCEAPDSDLRRSGQTAYWMVLGALVRLAAPILSFTCEEAWEYLPRAEDSGDSVFLSDFPAEAKAWSDDELGQVWERLLEVRRDAQRALEVARKPKEKGAKPTIGSSQQATVVLRASGETLELLREYEGKLAELLIVSDAAVEAGEAPEDAVVDCEVEAADGEKCPRCWNYWIEADSGDEVCPRCAEVLEGLGG